MSCPGGRPNPPHGSFQFLQDRHHRLRSSGHFPILLCIRHLGNGPEVLGFAFGGARVPRHASPTRAVLRKTAALQIALPTIFPLVFAALATPGTLVFEERYGMDSVPFVLVGWCVVLLGSAGWLNQVLFHRARTFLSFLAAIVAILSVWFWQRQAFTMLVPSSGLTYGYFLKPDGAKARFWVLDCPLWVGFACLAICCISALVSGWRTGARRSLVCMIPWWLAAFLVFALPSMYLDAQGNASVFI